MIFQIGQDSPVMAASPESKYVIAMGVCTITGGICSVPIRIVLFGE